MSSALFSPEYFAVLRRIARRRARQIGGQSPVPRAGQGRAGFERRPWQWGDDLRRLDWRASARAGRNLVRRREEDHGGELFLLLDQSASVLCGSGRRSLDLLRLALALGWLHLERGGALRIQTPQGSFRFSGSSRRPALRGFLESLPKPSGVLHWDVLTSRGRMICLTDPWSETPPARRSRAEVIRLVDPQESEPPLGMLALTESETGRSLERRLDASSWARVWPEHLRQRRALDHSQGWQCQVLQSPKASASAGQILLRAEALSLV